jgi:hypothetical protein
MSVRQNVRSSKCPFAKMLCWSRLIIKIFLRVSNYLNKSNQHGRGTPHSLHRLFKYLSTLQTIVCALSNRNYESVEILES